MAKAFDCVQMKHAIQARHARERQGLSDEQVRHLIARRLATSDDRVARMWRQVAGAAPSDTGAEQSQ